MADNPELVKELAEWGYCPDDFDLVINTHLHCDHIGGNRLFKNARILISRREYDYEKEFGHALRKSHDPVKLLSRLGRQVDGSTSILARDLKKLAEAYPISSLVGGVGQVEFLEDLPLLPPGISLLPTPGHSIAGQSILIKGNSGRVLVTGDALYHRDLWREISVLGINYNDEMFRESALHISKFRGIINPGHDRAFDNLTGQYLEEDSFKV